METYDEFKVSREKTAPRLQSKNSFHKGGTISDISDQISSLTTSLHKHDTKTELVVDKYFKEHDLQVDMEEEEFGYGKLIIDFKPPKNVNSRVISNKEREAKEVNKFAGVFSVRAALQRSSQDPLSAVDSMLWKKGLTKKSTKSKKMKPMLVELHVFPGYESDDLTPLPPPLSARDILETVTRAQLDLKKKPGFKKEFRSLILSRTSEAVLQDTFWWYFLQKYQPDKHIQELLFNRVAHNYVKLLFTSPETRYKETFFKRYPSLVSQAVYATFCHAFPTSYTQFAEQFKENLVNVVHLWIVGTRPLPRSWDKWQLALLEPNNMRKNEEIKKDASKGSLLHIPLDLTEENLSNQDSGIALSKRPLPTIIEDKSKNVWSLATHRRKSVSVRSFRRESVNLGGVSLGPSVSVEHVTGPGSLVSTTEQQTQSLSNIRPAAQNSSLATTRRSLLKTRESCPVGRGPEFSRAVFDVHGHSPLVEQFLKMQRLAKDAGTSVLIKRTEIKQLPPLSATTYKELVRKTLKETQKGSTDFKRRNEEDSRLRTHFARKQKKFHEDYSKRESDLLARHKEVKRISDLLVLDITKDGDEQSSGKAAEAIAAAMGFTDSS